MWADEVAETSETCDAARRQRGGWSGYYTSYEAGVDLYQVHQLLGFAVRGGFHSVDHSLEVTEAQFKPEFLVRGEFFKSHDNWRVRAATAVHIPCVA